MSRLPLRTERIRLEPMTTEHLPLLVELDADAEVLRPLLGRARTTEEAEAFRRPVCADTDADSMGLGSGWGWGSGEGNPRLVGPLTRPAGAGPAVEGRGKVVAGAAALAAGLRERVGGPAGPGTAGTGTCAGSPSASAPSGSSPPPPDPRAAQAVNDVGLDENVVHGLCSRTWARPFPWPYARATLGP